MNEPIQRWIVEVCEGGEWKRTHQGKWIFQAAVVRARELAINSGRTTRMIRA